LDCEKPHKSKGFCAGHVQQRDEGRELKPLRTQRRPNQAPHRPPAGFKWCGQCSNFKKLDEFYVNDHLYDGFSSACRECARSRQRSYAAKNPEAAKDSRLKRYYNLSLEQFYEMLRTQKGLCVLCKAPVGVSKGDCAVDHNHECCPGEKSCGTCVRSILCNRCNLGLGSLRDSPEVLRRAADYVESHQRKEVTK
jgi:hypothetical protein